MCVIFWIAARAANCRTPMPRSQPFPFCRRCWRCNRTRSSAGSASTRCGSRSYRSEEYGRAHPAAIGEMMRRIVSFVAVLYMAPVLVAQGVPAGFTNISAGPSLQGWHVSQVNHHGNTQWKVENGVLAGTQDKKDNGGIVLTDKKYRNFEVYLEMNPDYGCDSGLFLRSTEKGEAYQVTLDYL